MSPDAVDAGAALTPTLERPAWSGVGVLPRLACPAPVGRPALTAELLETDNRYFELGSRIRRLRGGHFVWAPEGVTIPLGCVVVRVGQPSTDVAARRWIAQVEGAVRDVGSRLSRLYLQRPTPVLEGALTRAGYLRRAEVAFLGPADGQPRAGPAFTLRPVTTRADWRLKAEVDAESSVGPDGYAPDAEAWQKLLRKKWETGHLRFYFVERDGVIGGTVGSMETDHVLRLKNLVIRPACRNSGFGRGATLALWQMACDTRKQALGVFAVPGGGGFATYSSAGLEVVATQYEWTKELAV